MKINRLNKPNNLNKSLKILLILSLTNMLLFSNLKRGEDGQDAEAMTYNDGRVETGLSFGMGSNGGYTANQEANFKTVLTVDKLPKRTPIPTGHVERADEIASQNTYYDGEITLNSVKINCHIYRDPANCVQTSQCGWCHAKNSCIAGNSLGPLEECPRSQYQFSWPRGVGAPLRVANNDDLGILNIRTFQRD